MPIAGMPSHTAKPLVLPYSGPRAFCYAGESLSHALELISIQMGLEVPNFIDLTSLGHFSLVCLKREESAKHYLNGYFSPLFYLGGSC